MVIGSNNSLTYLEPSSCWFKIFKFLIRHQEVPCDIQYSFYGVRFFDFRIYADKHGHIIAKNGKCKFPLLAIYEILDFFNKMGDVTLSLTLDESFEERMDGDSVSVERKFTEFCKLIDRIYSNIKLCGGYRRYDKKMLYEFDGVEGNEMMRVVNPDKGSMLYRFISRFCPRWIRKLNKKYIEEFKNENVYLLLNYVNRR